jgi:hypothetical protein
MKRILTILCSAVVMMTVSSCTKQYVSPATTNETVIKTVAAADWTLYTDTTTPTGTAYTASISVGDISKQFAQFGGIIVAISYDGGNTYEQLPEVYQNISFSYTYNAGNVTIYAQTPDGSAAAKPTDDIKVKIILVDSNY